MNTFVSLHGEIFKAMHNHPYEIVSAQIVSAYVCICLKYHAKLENEAIKKDRIRSKLNNLTKQKGNKL